jgi:hypothetical protein
MTTIQKLFGNIRAVAPVLAIIALTGPAFAASCEEELVSIKAEIDAMPSNADKSLAEHQLGKAQERLAAGKESSCLRYVESARSAMEAWRMHDND